MDLVSTFLTFYLIYSHVYFYIDLSFVSVYITYIMWTKITLYCLGINILIHIPLIHFISVWIQKSFCYMDLVSTFSYMCVCPNVTNLCLKFQLFTVSLITHGNVLLTQYQNFLYVCHFTQYLYFFIWTFHSIVTAKNNIIWTQYLHFTLTSYLTFYLL